MEGSWRILIKMLLQAMQTQEETSTYRRTKDKDGGEQWYLESEQRACWLPGRPSSVLCPCFVPNSERDVRLSMGSVHMPGLA